MMMPKQPIASTSHTDISLDQIGEIQPGLARLMAEISDRYWILYYAAKGGNWKLAALQSSELVKAFKIGMTTRPKYTGHLEAFIRGPMASIDKAIGMQDWDKLDEAYRKGISVANTYHKVWNHEEIVWQLPEDPPKHLKLTPP